MVFYTITWRKSTKKDLRKIPEGDVLEILQAVENLAGNPFPVSEGAALLLTFKEFEGPRRREEVACAALDIKTFL